MLRHPWRLARRPKTCSGAKTPHSRESVTPITTGVASLATPVPDLAAQQAALLYERHHGAILGYCLWRLRGRDDAEEAAQTTFTRALGALRRGHRPRNERAWLVTIARNVCTTLGTAPHRAREVVGDVPETIARDTDHGLDPDVQAALAALPDGQRRALLLREWQEFSYREIATELGVSLGTVESWIFRARRSLATSLEHTRRGFGLFGLLRSLGPSVGAKVAVATVLATTVVATEQAVVGARSPKATQPQLSPSVHLTDVSTRPAAVISSGTAAQVTRVHQTNRSLARRRVELAGGSRPDRSTPVADQAAPSAPPSASPSTPQPSTPQPSTPTQAAEPTPSPALPAVETPKVPLPAATLPEVQPPQLPELPPLPAVEPPALPSTDDLPVVVPTLP